MKVPDFGRYALCSCVAAAMLAGCGGSLPPIGAPGPMPQSSAIAAHAAMQQRAAQPLMQRTGVAARRDDGSSSMRFSSDGKDAAGYTYIGQFWAKGVNQYATNDRHNRGPVCEIPVEGFATGISVDRSGKLYVTGDFKDDHGQQISGVGVFGPNCGAQGATFSDPYGNPEDPVADGKTLYLSSQNDVSIPGSVAVYDLNGGSTPVAELTDPTVGVGGGVAVDSHHNLFWSSTDWWTGGGQVIEFRKGKMPGVVLKATKIGSDFPGGVILDESNNLLLIDQNADAIFVYAPPYRAAPFSTIAMKGSAWYCVLGLNQTRLYCLDDTYASVDAYTYPEGKYLFSYSSGIQGKEGPVGIAIQAPI